jgi:hypothetical protein
VTVNVALPDLPSLVAVIVVVPTSNAVATPDDDTVATAVLLDVHVTVRLVTVVPFASFTVAVNVAVEPLATLAVGGATVTVPTGMSVTVTVPDPDTPSLVAVMVAVPGISPKTEPEAGLTVATSTLLELQLTTRLVTTFPLTSFTIAVNVVLPAVGMLAVGGETATLPTGVTRTFTVADPDFPSLVAVMVAVPGVPPVTTPVDDTVAMEVLLDDHVTTRSVTTVPF